MLFTELQAGSDVGVTTAALKNEDGSYSITGNKIFMKVLLGNIVCGAFIFFF